MPVRTLGLPGVGLRSLSSRRGGGAQAPWLFGYAPGDDYAALGGAFARASAAYYTTDAGLLVAVGSDVLRDAHYVGGERTALLEPERTNLVPSSEAFSGVSLSDGATLTALPSEANPTGGAGAHLLGLPTAGLSRAFFSNTFQNVSGLVVGTLFVTASGGQTGTTAVKMGGGTPLAVTNHPVTAAWTRAAVTVDNGDGTAGARHFYLTDRRSDGADPVDAVVVWGAQAEAGAYATSYIRTTGSAATRAADALALPLPAGARYERYYDLASAAFTDAISDEAADPAYAVPTGRAYTHLYVFPEGTTLEEARYALGIVGEEV